MTEASAGNDARRDGTFPFRLGIGVACIGLLHYVSVLWSGMSLRVPWYVPAFAAAGGIVMAYGAWPQGLRRRLLAAGTILAAILGFVYLAVATRVPPYRGPAVGLACPEFTTRDARGQPVTRADLLPGAGGKGHTLTALVLFRGSW